MVSVYVGGHGRNTCQPDRIEHAAIKNKTTQKFSNHAMRAQGCVLGFFAPGRVAAGDVGPEPDFVALLQPLPHLPHALTN